MQKAEFFNDKKVSTEIISYMRFRNSPVRAALAHKPDPFRYQV